MEKLAMKVHRQRSDANGTAGNPARRRAEAALPEKFIAWQIRSRLELYEKLLRRIPDDAGLAVDLAEILRKKEDVAGAIRLLERFTRRDSAHVRAQVALARLCIDNGEPARASALLESVLDQLHAGAK